MPEKTPPPDPRLAAALARDDAREAAGMHGDDRLTCWTHQCWATDCADTHIRPAAAD